ncbi:MAG: hypothetical protein DDG60_00495 [Anaerolineae bacterium]|nr:MAG: hypothetical protein DDG60_00495 [Anaerolineae bacterium]
MNRFSLQSLLGCIPVRPRFGWLIFLFTLLLTACTANTLTEPAPTKDITDAQAGKSLYENFCLSCHGPSGKGNGPAATTLHPQPADLTALLLTHDDEYLAMRIAEGKQGTAMVAWKHVLNEAQIRQIVAYLRAEMK